MANVALAPSTIDTRQFYPRNIHIHGFQITDLMEHGWDPRPDLVELLDTLRRRRPPPTGLPGRARQGRARRRPELKRGPCQN